MKYVQKMKGGNELGATGQIQGVLDKVDTKQLQIAANPYYSSTDPALVRAPDALRKEAKNVGVAIPRGMNLGNVRNELEAASNRSMNQPR
jgi:hypothetical protein